MGSPPQAVKTVLAGCVILLTDHIKKNGEIIITTKDGKKEENYFDTARKYLLNDTRELLEILMLYDKDNINPNYIMKLQDKVIKQPEFSLAAAEKCSFATKFLYMWVIAMYDYYKVFTETRPLREQLVAMRKLVEEKVAELRIKKDALEKITAKIRELQILYD